MTALPGFIEDYRKLGFCLIPTGRDKKSLVEWKEFQTRQPTEEELAEWFNGKDVNVATVCGSISANLCNLDFDSVENYHKFFDSDKIERETPVVRTGRGIHVKFRSDRPIRSFKIEGLVEVQAEGKYCVVPPSIHSSGKAYEFVNSNREPQLVTDLERNIWVRAEQLGFKKKTVREFQAPKTHDGSGLVPNCIAQLGQGVKAGTRNDSAIHLASYWLNLRQVSREETWTWLQEWNLKNDPPLEAPELRLVLESASKGGYSYGCCLDSEVLRPLTLDELADILSSTVKHDKITKLAVFLDFLDTYTEDTQQNIAFEASSSSGKSYISVELAAYFPEEDVLLRGYTSPTAFFHETGAWDPKTKTILLDMQNKIIIFLDQPHDLLVQHLRPILSHDKKEIEIRITDKLEKKGMRTKRVRVIGFFTTVFCAAKPSQDEQEKTRFLFLSPESEQEKIRAAIYLESLKKGDKETYRNIILADPKRKWLASRIRALKNAGIKDVLIADHEQVATRFIEEHGGRLIRRHMRDIDRLYGFIKGNALLNFYTHEKTEDNRIKATKEDIDAGFDLYKDLALPNELGLPPESFKVFKEIVEPLLGATVKTDQGEEAYTGVKLKVVLQAYYDRYGETLPIRKLKEHMVPAWAAASLVFEDTDPVDRRTKILYPLVARDISARYIPARVGEDSKQASKGTLSIYIKNVPIPEKP